VDLQTLQAVSQARYLSPISALSEGRGSAPITVGTHDNLYLYDPRCHKTSPGGHLGVDQIDGSKNRTRQILEPPKFRREGYSRLILTEQPIPLSIVHFPSSGEDTADDGSDIYVAGRFPSILNYDRRCLSKPRTVIYSGASLSCLAHLPYPYSADAAFDMRKSKLSLEEVRSAKSAPGDTLIACGDYGGKGSLELYGLSEPSGATDLPIEAGPRRTLESTFQNRQVASSSKILSVTPHGTRLVFSDGNGYLTWVERDGFTLARQYDINHSMTDPIRGVFGTSDGYMGIRFGEIARKLMPTRKLGAPPATNVDNLLLWTGGEIGMLRFTSRPQHRVADFEESVKSLEEREHENSQMTYGEMVRRDLVAQADEARFMRGLGSSSSDS
jgi:hypothetical protein